MYSTGSVGRRQWLVGEGLVCWCRPQLAPTCACLVHPTGLQVLNPCSDITAIMGEVANVPR